MAAEVAWAHARAGAPAPRRTRLAVPGWGGDRDPTRAQPWHCKPFVEGATLGFELLWWRPEPVAITGDGDAVALAGAAAPEGGEPLVEQFAAGHYGIATGLALATPPGWGLLVLPHPAFAADPYGSTLPAVIPGLVESDWWPRSLFVACRVPPPGRAVALRFAEPYAQAIPVPLSLGRYDLRRMTPEEAAAQAARAALVKEHAGVLSSRRWLSAEGRPFTDAYKAIPARFPRDGAVDWDAARRATQATRGTPDGPRPGCPWSGGPPA